jgi:hypothetical protein
MREPQIALKDLQTHNDAGRQRDIQLQPRQRR